MNQKQTERFEALKLARTEMKTILVEDKENEDTKIKTTTTYKLFSTPKRFSDGIQRAYKNVVRPIQDYQIIKEHDIRNMWNKSETV